MIDIQNLITNKIGTDKLLHISFCGWIVSFFNSYILIVALTLMLGVGKELIDKYIRKTYFDYKDMLYTWLGGIITLLVIFIKNIHCL